ncbi:hypothetical protein ACFIOY_00105 [Bradyrhizobium sp. TZ2]
MNLSSPLRSIVERSARVLDVLQVRRLSQSRHALSDPAVSRHQVPRMRPKSKNQARRTALLAAVELGSRQKNALILSNIANGQQR